MKVRAGNQTLLRREQDDILQPHYSQFSTIVGVMIGWLTRSPLPNGNSFTDVVGVTGNIANFNDRWNWITSDMLPKWEQMSDVERSNLVDSPLGSQVGP